MLAAPDATEVDGFRELLRRFFLWIVFWVGLFYALSLTAIWWVPCLPPSTKPHENDRFWIVRNVIGAAHAILVTVLAVPACVALSGAPDDVRFASTPHLATCALDAGFPGGEYWSPHVEAVALAGLAFTAFTAADVVVSLLHGLATVDYMVHHGAFIVAGLVMRGNCVLPWKGSVQLCMEASTPFLSFLLLFQNRGKGCWLWVVISGIAFVVSYIYLRLLQNTYATVVLWLRRDTAMPARIPRWEVWFLLAAVTVGAAVQFFWFPAIAKKVLRAVSGYQELRGGDATAWLITTVADYYVLSACFCGVLFHWEPWHVALVWTLMINLLGSSCACLYMGLKLWSSGIPPHPKHG